MSAKLLLLLSCTISEVFSRMSRPSPNSFHCTKNLETSDKVSFLSDGANIALKLYTEARKLAKDDTKNVLLSPASVTLGLDMVAAGARGSTKSEILENFVPNVKKENEVVEKANEWLDSQLNSNGWKEHQLYSVNSLFHEETVGVLNEYLYVLEDCFHSYLRPVDFIHQPEKARQFINKWVEGKTELKIKDLIPSGAVDNATRLILVNAIYFKAKWERQFTTRNGASTEDSLFYPGLKKDKKSGQKAKFMHMESKFLYHETTDVQVLGVPYKNNELKMFFFLPKGSLKEFEGKLNSGSSLTDLMDKVGDRNVNVKIPKFKMETDLELKQALIDLGIKEMFSNQADFSVIFSDNSIRIKIADAFHKAFIQVNLFTN